MPTIVSAADRKLSFRKRVRLTKAETANVDKFLARLERVAADGDVEETSSLKNAEWVTDMGFKYLGAGIDKTAFLIPGGRYVVKVARWASNILDGYDDCGQVSQEAAMYSRATPAVRECLAVTRAVRPWAAIQEAVEDTVGNMLSKSPERWDEVNKAYRELRDKLSSLTGGDEDLHQGNIGIRSDGSAVCIDFALEQI